MKKNLKKTLIIFSILFFVGIGCVFFAHEQYQTELPQEGLLFTKTTDEKAEPPSQPEKGEEKKIEPEKTPSVPVASPNVLLSATQLEQGDTLIVTVDNVASEEKITGKFDGQTFDLFPYGNTEKWMGIVGIDAKKAPGNYKVLITTSDGENIQKTIKVLKRKFAITEITLTPELEAKGYTPSNIAENIATKDGVLINEVLQGYTPVVYFSKDFAYPLRTLKDVGNYGNVRKEGDIVIQHLGVDLDASLSTPVYASNDGVVAFAKELIVFGKTIIVDHGFGIYSLYLHLDEFKVSEEDRVVRGETIGLSGSTGWSLGPHLHFSIKVKGASVDPLKFIKTIRENIK